MGVDGFSFGGGAEQLGNLRQAFLVSLLGESEVLAVSLRFTSESSIRFLSVLLMGVSFEDDEVMWNVLLGFSIRNDSCL